MPRRRAARGEGGVTYDRTRGDWRARYPLGVVDGRRRYLSGRAPTEDDAWAVWDRLRATAGGDAVLDDRTTLDAYLRDWLATHAPTVRASTAATYRIHIDTYIGPLLGGIPVVRLRPEDVDRLIASMLARTKSPAYVHRVVTTLRIALGRAVRRRLLPDNVAAMASLPRVELPVIEPMTEADADAIREAVRGTWVSDVVRLILGSGLRIGEAVGLDWGDVYEDEGYVLVRRTKTMPRPVVITEDAASALRDLRASRVVAGMRRADDREPVFLRRRRGRGAGADDMRMRQQSVTHALPDILEARKLRRLAPHALRHGFATMLTGQGVPAAYVGGALGHRDGGALAGKRYIHVIPEHLRNAVRKLDRRTG